MRRQKNTCKWTLNGQAKNAKTGLSKLKAFFSELGNAAKSVKTLSYSQKAKIFDSLSVYINSGISISEAVRLMSKDSGFKKIFGQIYADIVSGISLSEAVSNTGVFDEMSVFTIYTAQETGRLGENFKLLADYYKNMDRMKKDFEGALFYPAVLLAGILFLIIFINFFYIPSLMSFFDENALSASKGLAVRLSYYLNHYTFPVCLMMISFLIFPYFSAKAFIPEDNFMNTILKLPLIGKLTAYRLTVNLLHPYAMLIESGIDIVSAAGVISNQSGSSFLKKHLRLLAQSLSDGDKVSSSFAKLGFLDETTLYYIELGENTGTLPENFKLLTDRYREMYNDITKQLLKGVEPFLIVVMSIILGFVMISVINPMLELTSRF